MSYESAPSTALCATHCCICGRPLRDAESLKAGIGPDCAENTGFYREAIDPVVRDEVNQIVHRLAVIQRCPEAVPLLARLRDLGFATIADRIDSRLVELVAFVIAHDEAANVLVVHPTVRLEKDQFTNYVADLRQIPGRKSEKIEEPGKPVAWRTTVPNNRATLVKLVHVLVRYLPGRVVRTPIGLTTIPGDVREVEAFVTREVGDA